MSRSNWPPPKSPPRSTTPSEKRSGVMIGEMARAAEALERAAAAEREIARESATAGAEKGLTAEQLERLSTEHEHVKQVAEKIAQGVSGTAPEAARQLAEAKTPVEAAAKELASAKNTPGEKSKRQATETAKQTTQAAQSLEQRGRQTARPDRRRRRSFDQGSRPAIDSTWRDAPADRKIARPRSSPRGRHNRAIGPGVRACPRGAGETAASGRTSASRGGVRAGEQNRQGGPDEPGGAARDRRCAASAQTPREASAAQKKAAEAIADAAKQVEGDAAADSARAKAAADEAVKQSSAGDAKKAASAQAAAGKSLADARKAAQRTAAKAAAAPTGDPDAKTQEEVGKLAADAQQAAAPAPKQRALADANRGSSDAEQAIVAADKKSAASSQQRSADALAKAADEIAKAIDAAGNRESALLPSQASNAGQLARKASKVDPAATSALRNAQKTAQSATQASPTAQQAAEASAGLQGDLQRPRPPTLPPESNRSSATWPPQKRSPMPLESNKRPATKSQSRARRITEASTQEGASSPAGASPNGKPGSATPSAALSKAAQALQAAQNQFADAQRALGQAAVEVSGQEQVANPPIRQALDEASQLGAGRWPTRRR